VRQLVVFFGPVELSVAEEKSLVIALLVATPKKKGTKGGEQFLFDLSDYLTCCFRFAGQIFVYPTWNLIPSIPSKYPDVVFLSVTFSPAENETRDKFTSGSPR